MAHVDRTGCPRRLLQLREAACYCGVSTAVFKREFAVRPVKFLFASVSRYDIDDLDREIEKRKSQNATGVSVDWIGLVGK